MTVRALLFTDVVDSTLLVERLGDERAAQVWAEHDRRARALLAHHGGCEIDRSDGFFLLFDEPVAAAHYALAYHQALAELALNARVGLHVGAVSLRENTTEEVGRGAKRVEVEGLAKPFAARVMGLARGGQTLLSAAARTALGDVPPDGTEVESHGHYRLKGVEEPVEVFELGPRGAAFSPPVDADKAYRVVRNVDLWRPAREVRHNLPAERDAFIGRTAELRVLAQRLDAGARLLTVVGPGGTGKTRFVRRYGHAWLGDWPGGVYFCDLSEARSLEGIFFAVAVAVGVSLGKGDPGVQLGHVIAGRDRCLIILDNFEQVVEHASATLGRWLDRSAAARFVVTSRERLHVPGEELFAIEPLPVAREAIELFDVRARAQRPDFAITEANRAAVAEVVRLLDGLPLAIELAAARARVFSPVQLVERMRDRFALLAGARGAAARQATLRAAIDWSWDLLAPWEQGAFAQCSVFEGGFTMLAAEAVLDLARWPDAPPVMDAVQMLVDKSLLRNWVGNEPGRYDIDEPHFGMYVSIHEYASERLDARAQHAAHGRHGRYFAGFGSDAALDALVGRGGGKLRRAIALELDNLVAACRRSVGRGDAETAVGTYRAAWEVLELQGPVALGVALGSQVLGVAGAGASTRAAAVVAHAAALRRLGRMDEASEVLLHALGLARSAGDRRREAVVLCGQGVLRREQGAMNEGREVLETAVALSREVGDARIEGMALSNLGTVLLAQGRIDEALAHQQAALTLHRGIGDRRSESIVLGNLGVLHRDQGRMDEARTAYEQALAIHREVGNRLFEGITFVNLGNLHAIQGRIVEGQNYFEAALPIFREIGDRRTEGILLGNMGIQNNDEGRLDAARACYEQALAIHREVGNRQSEGAVLTHLAGLYAEPGRMEDARAHYLQALGLYTRMGDRRDEGCVLGDLAGLLVMEGRHADAQPMLAQALALLRIAENPFELSRTLCVLARADVGLGKLESGRAALAEADALAAQHRRRPGVHAGPGDRHRSSAARMMGPCPAMRPGPSLYAVPTP